MFFFPAFCKMFMLDKNCEKPFLLSCCRVVEQEAQRSQQVSQDRKSPSRTNGCSKNRPIDILEMLSKAKDEYERVRKCFNFILL